MEAARRAQIQGGIVYGSLAVLALRFALLMTIRFVAK